MMHNSPYLTYRILSIFYKYKLCFYTKNTALFIYLLILNSVLFAQADITMRGRIINSETKSPVDVANIYIKNIGIGVIPNNSGEFTFHIPYSCKGDTVYISSMGYKNYVLPITEYKNEEYLTIKLKPYAHMLDQVIVKTKNKRGTAEKLIKKAIANMELNYPQSPYQIGGYYRDYLEIKRKYYNLFEAAIEVEDKGFASDDVKTTRIRLLQLRYNPQFPYDSSQIMLYDNRKMKFIPGAHIHPMDGNEFLILRSHDALRNNNRFTLSFLDYFSKSFVRNHDFKIDSISYMNDVQVYSISFEYNNRYGYDSAANFSAKGYLVLRTDNFAISKIVYETHIFDKDYDGPLYNLDIEYRELDGKYYPHYLSFGNYFKIRNRVDTSTFAFSQTVLRKKIRVLDIHFNRNVDTISGKDTSNFSIRYGKTRIPINAISVSKNIVRILLKIDTETLNLLTDEGDLVLTIGAVTDLSGNRMAGKYNGYFQHREFFVNKISPSITEEFPYSEVIPKTMPLYWNQINSNPEFWNTYNAAYDRKLK